GAYRAAIDSFTASYRLSGAPELLFNIGRAYLHEPGGCADALHYFQDYQAHENDVARRSSAQPLVDSAAACVAREAHAADPAATSPAPVSDATPTAAVPSAPRTSEHGGGHTWKYLLVGGATAVVAGTIFVGSVSLSDDCRPSCSPSQVSGL